MIPSHGTHLRAHLHGQSLGWIPYVLVEADISEKVMVSHVLMTTPKLVKICMITLNSLRTVSLTVRQAML